MERGHKSGQNGAQNIILQVKKSKKNQLKVRAAEYSSFPPLGSRLQISDHGLISISIGYVMFKEMKERRLIELIHRGYLVAWIIFIARNHGLQQVREIIVMK